MDEKMKIMWHSNAPWAATGYGAQTALTVPYIKKLGYDIAVSAFYGLHGSKIGWNDNIPVYPATGFDDYGNDILAAHTCHHLQDGDPKKAITITLVDVWVLNPQITQVLNWVPWVPVDHKTVPPRVVNALKMGRVTSPIAMSRHGEKALKEAGFNPYYIPHGVDKEKFKVLDRDECRKRVGADPDKFWIGVVAANKGNGPSRKSWPQIIEAFAKYHKINPDARLYVHTEVKGKCAGVDLEPLLQIHGVPQDSVTICDQYQYTLGFSEEYMCDIYNSMDVLLNPAMGEGFGIPILEAQSCGTPVIVTDYTAMSELCGAGWKVGGVETWTPQESFQMVPHIHEIVEALGEAYETRGSKKMRKKARNFAEQYDILVLAEHYWKPTLEKIQKQCSRGNLEQVQL
jgi:glycosyltransferase involved in cell wall biosynthesis